MLHRHEEIMSALDAVPYVASNPQVIQRCSLRLLHLSTVLLPPRNAISLFLIADTASLLHHSNSCTAFGNGKRKYSGDEIGRRRGDVDFLQHGVPHFAGAVDKSEAAQAKERKQIEEYKTLESEVTTKVRTLSPDCL